MSTGIMIIGPSGSGKTTLGKIVAQKLGYLYFDVDDYIWKQNTDSPYTQMYTREEKISRHGTASVATGVIMNLWMTTVFTKNNSFFNELSFSVLTKRFLREVWSMKWEMPFIRTGTG